MSVERIMGSNAAVAVGRFNPDGIDGYRASTAPDAPLRDTREQAVEDERAHLDGEPVKHNIRWFVKSGDDFIPREATMRGEWAYEAKCSCGWETHTGGAVRSFIEKEIADHKFDVAHGFWTPES